MGVLDSLKSAANTVAGNISDNLSSMGDSLLGNNNKATLILGGYELDDNGSMLPDAALAISVSLPFNPSSIKIDAIAGGGHKIVNTKGTSYQTIDPRIQVSFTAYVDEVNNSDAFLFEKVNTGGGAVGLTRTAYNLAGGHEYNVSAYVEGLLAALRKYENSQVIFAWGKMEYMGALNNISARYTMFNKSGNPIKAEIGIRILCLSSEKKEMKTEWKIKYDDAMEELKADYGSTGDGIDLSNASVTDRIIG